jgi:hypothetical protein
MNPYVELNANTGMASDYEHLRSKNLFIFDTGSGMSTASDGLTPAGQQQQLWPTPAAGSAASTILCPYPFPGRTSHLFIHLIL